MPEYHCRPDEAVVVPCFGCGADFTVTAEEYKDMPLVFAKRQGKPGRHSRWWGQREFWCDKCGEGEDGAQR